ncbi:MAG: hypothetical protein ACREIV_10780 [Planctomycetaceae bacterium]
MRFRILRHESCFIRIGDRNGQQVSDGSAYAAIQRGDMAMKAIPYWLMALSLGMFAWGCTDEQQLENAIEDQQEEEADLQEEINEAQEDGGVTNEEREDIRDEAGDIPEATGETAEQAGELIEERTD